MDVPMEHVSSEDTVPPHSEGSNEEAKEESIKVIYLESEKKTEKGDEKDNEDVFTNDEEVEIIDKKKEEKNKGEDKSEDESITDRSRAQENNNDDKAKGKIDEKDKDEEVVEESSKDERSDEKKDNEDKEDT